MAKKTNGEKDESYRIFSKEYMVNNDSYKTKLCNNDIIVGGTGTGKTTVVLANLNNTDENVICTDVKGQLYRRTHASLERRGFKVSRISFTDPSCGSGFNPLKHIRRKVDDSGNIVYNQQDILSLGEAICPTTNTPEPFWEQSAQAVLVCLIAYVLDAFPEEEQNLVTVMEVFNLFGDVERTRSVGFLDEYSLLHPESLTARSYAGIRKVFGADRTVSCIFGYVSTALSKFESDEIREMLTRPESFDIDELGDRKSALFVEVSDLDRTFDSIVNLLYTTLLLNLCRKADSSKDGILKRPVRFWLDDYAASAKIRDFDKTISVLRSRNISASLILQSISQLRSAYTSEQSSTICSNADHIMFLGNCFDSETLTYLCNRASVVAERILSLPDDKAMMIARGQRGARLIKKLDPAVIDDYRIDKNKFVTDESGSFTYEKE